jgi:hypothetical protein
MVVHPGCGPGERAAQRTDEAAAAAEEAAAEQGGTAAGETTAAAEAEAGAPEAVGADTAPEGPGAVAPAAEAEARAMRNWVLLEFSRPLEEGDLEWLEANGFRVDSVMGELRVRGWLEDSEGGRAIASDPRIARVHTQMR